MNDKILATSLFFVLFSLTVINALDVEELNFYIAWAIVSVFVVSFITMSITTMIWIWK